VGLSDAQKGLTNSVDGHRKRPSGRNSFHSRNSNQTQSKDVVHPENQAELVCVGWDDMEVHSQTHTCVQKEIILNVPVRLQLRYIAVNQNCNPYESCGSNSLILRR
jgi:hypothetical protein